MRKAFQPEATPAVSAIGQSGQARRLATLRGRGAVSNADSHHLAWQREADLDALEHDPEALDSAQQAPQTVVSFEQARTIISRNASPDIPFDRSLNPYRGCEHGCIYCYARPSHTRLGLSAGLDFETRITVKQNAAQCLEQELSRSGYRPALIALGANTDPYQPLERVYEITRQLLGVLRDFRHPVAITTKSALVLRDLDLLTDLARDRLIHVWLSIPTLDRKLARQLDPRAPSPARRLQVLEALSQAGVSCGVLVAPVIPVLTDTAIEQVIAAAAQAGARHASYVTLRLPQELYDLFSQWLDHHLPDARQHILSRIEQSGAGGRGSQAFGVRMHGRGIFADLVRQRFALACRKAGLQHSQAALNTTAFCVPGPQGNLFA